MVDSSIKPKREGEKLKETHLTGALFSFITSRLKKNCWSISLFYRISSSVPSMGSKTQTAFWCISEGCVTGRIEKDTISPRPSIRNSVPPLPLGIHPPSKLRGKTSFTGSSSFFVIACERPCKFKELATVWMGLDACWVATDTITLEPKNCSEKNTQKMSYTNRHRSRSAQILIFGSRTWLTNAMQIEMPSTLFKSQWPVTSQAATTTQLTTTSKPCVRLKEPQQPRFTMMGSSNPICEFM